MSLDIPSTLDTKQTHVRYLIISVLFAVSCFSYGDRVALSIAGTEMSKDISMNALKLGYLFSGFSWAYVLGQLPSGGLLDRFGSKRVYGISIVVWSMCALLTGFAGYLAASVAFSVIFLLRLVSGFAQAPVFPGNGRIVAAWFPAAERGRASAIFNASQYFALMVFAPILGWITHAAGWKSCFWFMGALGFVFTLLWFKTIYGVKDHPRISNAEIDYIEQGGGLVNTDRGNTGKIKGSLLTWAAVKELLSHRMLVGIYLGQYCITTLTWFFLTWFPIYLSQARHMSIMKVGFCSRIACAVRGSGGHTWRSRLRPPAARGPLSYLCPQSANRDWDVAIRGDDRMQLCQGAKRHASADVAGLLWQGVWSLRVDGDLRYFTKGNGWPQRRTVQPHWQSGRNYNADNYWISG